MVAYYPPGEQLFTAPDWPRLRDSDGEIGLEPYRREIKPTDWGVLILSTPSHREKLEEGSSVCKQGSRGLQRRELPALRGDPVEDAQLLSKLQQVPLRAVRRGGPRAYRACDYMP